MRSFLPLLILLIFASCTSDVTTVEEPPKANETAVNFGLYNARPTRDTRAMTMGESQDIDLGVLKGEEGFGVYAYDHTGHKFFPHLAHNTYPTFMFNQQVTYDEGTGTWRYKPLKYWPNGEDDYLTFQAYAPYQKNLIPLYDEAYNGVGIRYDIRQAYDLLWGSSAVDDNAVCLKDVKKPSVSAMMLFVFKHALSKVDFTVSYNADNVDCDDPGELAPETRVVIRSVRLLGALPSRGILSLYDGSWKVERLEENLYDFTSSFFDHTENIGNLPGAKPCEAPDVPGVLTRTQPKLYAHESIMMIPAKSDARLHIVYDVITRHPNGEEVITSNSIISDDIPTHWGSTHPETEDGIFHLTAGKHTTINIHIGLTSIKFDASVEDWLVSSAAFDATANKE